MTSTAKTIAISALWLSVAISSFAIGEGVILAFLPVALVTLFIAYA